MRNWTRVATLALTILLLPVLLAACNNKEDPQKEENDMQEQPNENALPLYDAATHGKEGAVYFEATVLEIQENFILVAPIEGKSEGMQQDQVLVNTTTVEGEKFEGFTVGDTVGVLCAPMVTMSLPAQVPSVYGFYSAK